MHPFGGTPICPRCNKAVYAAEQVNVRLWGQLYHKPCLACTFCNKRLDSLTLLEHDQQPYCKSCHVKNFGTRDLRQANLPHRESSFPSPSPLPASPVRQNTFSIPPHRFTTSPSPSEQGVAPSSPVNLRDMPLVESDEAEAALEMSESMDQVTEQPIFPPRTSPLSPSYTGPEASTNTGAGLGGFPRTVPGTGQMNERPSHRQSNSLNATPVKFSAVTLGRSNSSAMPGMIHSPLAPTATGTAVSAGSTGSRYGVALNVTGTASGGSPIRKWGTVTPTCPRCGKSVFFAEQAKAAGQTWHKGCLRCTECGTSLDSTRLTEKEGQPLCRRCYSKLHGPQGSGYALLGKAGG